MKKINLTTIVIMIILLYHGVSAIRWSIVHPKANQMTTITHIVEVWSWQTCEELK